MEKSRVLFGWSSRLMSSHAVPAKIGHDHNRLLHSRVLRLLCGGASALIFGCLSPQAEAGSLSLGFEPAEVIPGALYGTATVDVSGGVNSSGVLKMNTANGQAGFMVLDDLDGGQAVKSFLATFNLRTGSDTSTVMHGDGLSFNFGPDIPDGTFVLPEEGAGSGLRVSFDTFNNGGPANEAPAIEVTYNNTIIATKLVNYLSTRTGYVVVKIEVHPEGTLDLYYGTNAVFTNLLCYSPIAGRFSLAANASAERFVGDPIDLYWVDNLSITTAVSPSTFIQSANPRGSSVSPDAVIAIRLQDGTAQVNPNSVKLNLDSSPIAASVISASGLTTIMFVPSSLLTAGSTHLVELAYADDAVPPKTNSVSYSFTVYPYLTLPASYAVSAASVNMNSSGFKLRTHQVSVDAGTSVQRGELQFANQLLNPADSTLLPNIADLSAANPDGTFDIATGFINYNTAGGDAGFFTGDSLPPGLTNPNQYALAITTFLSLAPGAYTFGVDAVRNYDQGGAGTVNKSGFRITTGANPADFFAPQIAVFDQGRPEGESVFSFVVPQAGIYPVRLLWFSGSGDSSLEWYQIKPDGTRILVGDVGLGGITNYGAALVTHPYVQYTTNPKPGDTDVPANTPIGLTVADGSATVQTNTIQLRLNGNLVTASVTNNPANPGVTYVNYQPPVALAGGSSNTVRLVFSDSSGANYDQQWSFVVAGNLVVPGLLVVEAEHFSANVPALDLDGINMHQWDLTVFPGYSGEGAMVADPNINYNQNISTNVEPRLDYTMNFTIPGTYHIWVRAQTASTADDSVNVGIDGALPDTSYRIGNFAFGPYNWSSTQLGNAPATFNVATPGFHVVNVWMREDGFILDKLLFTTNSAYIPTGFGPSEAGVYTIPPVLTFSQTANSLTLTWTGGGVLQGATSVAGPYALVTGGSNSPVTVPMDQPKRFFRVAK